MSEQNFYGIHAASVRGGHERGFAFSAYGIGIGAGFYKFFDNRRVAVDTG